MGLALFFIFINAKAQLNSPWRKYGDQTVSGVVVAPGCHEYSLTGGQGYSVYLRNKNMQPVNVSGTLTANTVCGKEYSTQFSVNLEPGQIAQGSDFDKNSQTGQTSVVSPADCGGVKYTKIPSYTNRIKNVSVSNVQVTPLGGGVINQLQTAPASVATSITPSTITNTTLQTPTVKFDSLTYYRELLNSSKLSFENQISSLKVLNNFLSDSLKAKTNQYTDLLNINTTIPAAINSAAVKNPSIRPLELLLQAGLGWDKLPLIVNNDSTLPLGSSYTGASSHPLLQLGLLAKLFNNSLISVELNPFVTYGIDVLNSDNGNHLTYGINANVLAALSKSSPLKVVLNGAFTGRNGSWENTPAKADYSYSFMKYGLGLRYAFNNKFWIQPKVSWDNPSSKVTGASPSLVASLETEIAKKWNISLSYSPDYFNQGDIKYPFNFADGKQEYFGFRLLHNFKLIK